jgi:protein required for attachment to host cells
MKAVRTWVLIADGGNAKVLETRGVGPGLEAQADMVFSADLPRSHDILTDRAGRGFESQGHARHAMESPVDPHRELKRAFAKKLGKVLESKLAEDRFDRLILVAPPPALGDLRSALPKKVRAKVVAELAHDLVKIPHNRIWSHLEVVLGKEPRRVAGAARRRPAGAGKPRKRSKAR